MAHQSIYAMAVSNATAELASLMNEFSVIEKRKLQLEAFIANAKPLLGEFQLEMPELPKPIPLVVRDRQDKRRPLWDLIRLAMQDQPWIFIVSDAVEGLGRIGHPVKSSNRAQIVRNAMMKKPAVFDFLGDGKFRLVYHPKFGKNEDTNDDMSSKNQEPTEVDSW